MISAIQFLYKSIQPLEKFPIGPYETISLNSRRCYVFRPSKSKPKIILFVQGMTVRGIDDIRLIKQCEIFRQLGYLVYLPHYPEIQNLDITPNSIKNITEDIKAIYQGNNQKMGIVSVSYSGGLSILASSQEDVRDYVDSLMIVGTFAHFKSMFEFLFLRKDIDPYGYFILLKNFLKFVPQYNIQELIEAFNIAAVDDGLHRQPPLLNEHFRKYPHIQKIFSNLMEDLELRKQILEQIFRNPFMEQLFQEFDVFERIRYLKARISLLHGRNDQVIPPSESMLLFEECKKYQIPCKLTTTSLLDHGNIKFNLDVLEELLQLIDTINFFL